MSSDSLSSSQFSTSTVLQMTSFPVRTNVIDLINFPAAYWYSVESLAQVSAPIINPVVNKLFPVRKKSIAWKAAKSVPPFMSIRQARLEIYGSQGAPHRYN